MGIDFRNYKIGTIVERIKQNIHNEWILLWSNLRNKGMEKTEVWATMYKNSCIQRKTSLKHSKILSLLFLIPTWTKPMTNIDQSLYKRLFHKCTC